MSKRLLFSLLILTVGVVLLSGCFSDSIVDKVKNDVALPNDVADWNFIVYLDADNNLESYAIADMNEMEVIGSDSNINILVLIDRISGYDSSNGNWTGARLYRVTKDPNNSSTIVSQLITNYGELDMSDPQTLTDFIIDCQTLYPSNKTALTMWNHGDGIYPRNDKGICWDDTTGGSAWDCLTGDEVASALADARAVTGKKIDVLNMDACLMQFLEIAYEWRSEVDYLVGSQETVPGNGNYYTGPLDILQDNPSISAWNFAKSLVDEYADYYTNTSTTYSAMSLGTSFNTLMTSFSNFATAMYNTSDLNAVDRARRYTTSFTYNEYLDLYMFAGNIASRSSDSNAVNKANALRTAISNANIYHRETRSYINNAYGLSIFLPNSSEWSYYSGQDQYVTFPLSVDTDWDDFVIRYAD